MSFLAKQDPNVKAVIDQELMRQRDKLEMIASENIVSQAVMEAQGSVLTNKYAEGYPWQTLLWWLRTCGRSRNIGY